MKILALAPQWPDPPRQGAAIRNLQILLYLAARHDVSLLTFDSAGMERERLAQLCTHAEALPHPARTQGQRLLQLVTSARPDMGWRLHSDAMSERVRQLCSDVEFDAVHVEGLEMAPYGLLAIERSRKLRGRAYGAPALLYDAHNAEFLLQRRAFTTDIAHPGRLSRAVYSLLQWWRLRRFERKVCLASSHILAVSRPDLKVLAALAPRKKEVMRVLPNGVDPLYWSRDAGYPPAEIPPGTDALVFDGTMDFRPNVDAVLWFASYVWPLIRADRPNVRLYIVGRNPTQEVQALEKTPGITVTGQVEDTRGWVAGATVYVVPMRMGGGVRLKVLQAMAMGCAIVSTPMGAEGVDVHHGRDVLLARSPISFTASVLQLLGDPQLRADLGKEARQTATTQYAWDKLLPLLDEVYSRP